MKKENWGKEFDNYIESKKGHEEFAWHSSGLKSFIRQLLEKQKEEIIEETKKDLDAGMFIKICSNEETFMRYLKQKLTK